MIHNEILQVSLYTTYVEISIMDDALPALIYDKACRSSFRNC
jgi:hypothetical protein